MLEGEHNTYLFKVIVAGEGGVGKTTFINRYATNKFIEDTKMTIGVSFYSFENKISEDVTIKLQVWDFGGEKRFRFILPSYCEGAHGVIFAFDLTRISSLLNLHEWLDLVKTNTRNAIFLLIGTKADLVQAIGFEAIDDELIAGFMKTHDLSPDLFIKTSSKTGKNVENVFTKLVDLFYSRMKK
jgi:small GTP-binding protein